MGCLWILGTLEGLRPRWSGSGQILRYGIGVQLVRWSPRDGSM